MRYRLLVSTLAIASVCVVILGMPLVLLARHEVWTSARDRVRDQASTVATGLEDRIDRRATIDLSRYLRRLPRHRITVLLPGHSSVSAGPALRKPIAATVSVADATITVEADRTPTATRAREVTLFVGGLAVAAVAAAVALALWQARRLARPLAELADRADRLGRAEFAAVPLRSGVPEIDRVSAELERSARRLAAFIDLQQQFASDAAHQLRTPLTGIGLHLDEISRIGSDDVRVEADDALGQMGRLNDVITSLLARARGDLSDQEDVDLAALVTEGSASWHRVLARSGRTLHVDVEARATVRARREHLLGVLASLLDNAVAHGRGDVRAIVDVDGKAARLRVRDGGVGVPVELRDSVFDRRVSGGQGTGIGLALARSLAAAESGALALSADDPAEFVLTLPLARPAPTPTTVRR